MKDLSDIPENKEFPAYHSSMAGGNMVTEKNPHFAGQGSPSEATDDITAKDIDWVGYSHDTPVLPGEETPGEDLDVFEKGTGYTPTARTWKELD